MKETDQKPDKGVKKQSPFAERETNNKQGSSAWGSLKRVFKVLWKNKQRVEKEREDNKRC